MIKHTVNRTTIESLTREEQNEYDAAMDSASEMIIGVIHMTTDVDGRFHFTATEASRVNEDDNVRS